MTRRSRIPLLGRWSLRITILAAFTTLFVAAVLFIVVYSYRRNTRAILESSDDLFNQATDTVLEKTVAYLQAPADAARIGAGLVGQGTLTIEQPEGLRSYLVQLVQTHPQVVMVYFTHHTGNHVGIERKPDGGLDWWDLRQDGEGRSLSVFGITPSGQLQHRHTRLVFGFYPRQRPWFRIPRRTGRHHWTDAYPFFSSKRNQLGITVSYPARTPEGNFLGVVAADIELRHLSRFVSRMTIGKSGKVLIVDSRDQLIAYPDYTRVFRRRGKKLALRKVRDLGLAWLSAGLKAMRDGSGRMASYSSEGDRYLMAQRALPASLGARWRILVAAPEDDFVGTLKQTNRNAILVALVVLILGVLLIAYISSRISRPIVQLAEETRRIQEFDLEGRPDIRSPISEIQLLDESLGAMKTSLAAFGKFVPAELVREILATQQAVEIGGEERELTLFFSDIKDFTSISEQMAPRELMEFVSEYLEALSQVLLQHGATIDKFIGDAIMAFWNAPLARADHPARACRAALACQQRLSELNERWTGEGRAPLITRIGLHTGRTVVGNIGSSERLNYTSLGDSVNLASRLEGANKLYGTAIIASESTATLTGEEFVFRILDRLVVKGREEPVTIYELLGTRDGDGAATHQRLADGFGEGFEHYLKRRFEEARDTFQALQGEFPDDPVLPRFIQRCASYQRDPPGESWRGELRSTTK